MELLIAALDAIDAHGEDLEEGGDMEPNLAGFHMATTLDVLDCELDEAARFY
ncbi:hypothetical protein [Alsobacter metallidurans]|uniref:hypothetical protein n=1 Tax=Alsobacter metallidurans TaxID=340221 RepID=UPI00166315E6|nr:hypothetical protein [Alsobacter metallidurans]